ncbi:hypothetical protein PYS61_05535 [Amygdalobacter indicium]|uniref:NodB homology domain-containing protein n=1 Tax=Amygdalobacter indicium TaxID=3029272 RepID=A0ABY8C450_9FIRM|nr:hypothetical protein [Amygdalobacter indicium]WEG35391.1 hypothetical protein PYS61_05535 [Amygdalobacter indicium]
MRTHQSHSGAMPNYEGTCRASNVPVKKRESAVSAKSTFKSNISAGKILDKIKHLCRYKQNKQLQQADKKAKLLQNTIKPQNTENTAEDLEKLFQTHLSHAPLLSPDTASAKESAAVLEPQSLQILTYRGVTTRSNKKQAETAEIVNSKTVPSQSEWADLKNDLRNLRRESHATWDFSQKLLQKFWTRGKNISSKEQQKLVHSTFKLTCKNFCASIIFNLSRQYQAWRKYCQHSTYNTQAHNSQLANLSFWRKFSARRCSIVQTLCFVLAVILIFSTIFTIHYHQLASIEADNNMRRELDKKHGILLSGTAQCKKAELDQINLHLTFPHYDDSYLDYKIQSRLDSLIQPYIQAANKLPRRNSFRQKPLLVVNYDSAILAGRLVSLIFTLNYYEGGAAADKLSDLAYSSLYYDLQYHSVLTLKDLLSERNNILQEIADSYNTMYRYDLKQDLGLQADQITRQNFLFTPEKLILLVNPKQSHASLLNNNSRLNLVSNGGSRYIYNNYLSLKYNEVSKYFNQQSDLKVSLKYDSWKRYLANKDSEKLLPYTQDSEGTTDSPYKFSALTINNLPTEATLTQLLKILHDNAATASFFLTPQELNTDNLPTLQNIISQGHEIALLLDNNSYTQAQITAASDFLKQKLHATNNYLRLLEQQNNAIRDDLQDYIQIKWNNYPRSKNQAAMIKQLTSKRDAGDIICLDSQDDTFIAVVDKMLEQQDNQFRYAAITQTAEIYRTTLTTSQSPYTDISAAN